MHNSKVIFLINDDVRAISVSYEVNGDPYIFKTMNQDIKADDYVVIQTKQRHFMTVAKVVETDLDIDIEDNTELQWIVDKVDRENFDLTVEEEKVAIKAVQSAEKRKKREQLRKTLYDDNDEKIKSLALTSAPVETK